MALDTILAKAATLIITVEKLVYGQGSTVAKMYIHYATALRLNIPVLAPLNTIHIAKSLVVVIHVHQIHAKIMAHAIHTVPDGLYAAVRSTGPGFAVSIMMLIWK